MECLNNFFLVKSSSDVAVLVEEINNAVSYALVSEDLRGVSRVYLIKVGGLWYIEGYWLESSRLESARMHDFWAVDELVADSGLSRAVFSVQSNKVTAQGTLQVAFKSLELVKEFFNI